MKLQAVAIVGTGLIGASVGRGLLARGLARRVIGLGRGQENLKIAQQNGCVTEWTTDLAQAVQGVSLVVVCTPVGGMVEQIRQAAESAPSGTIFTDVGSTKASLVAALQNLPNGCVFVGGHPIAGKETSGAVAADGDLFVGKTTILTPIETTPTEALQTVRALWQALGARVQEMTPTEHDAILAETSHLPHVLSVVLSVMISSEKRMFSGTGLASMTRLAAGNQTVWRDILRDNRTNVRIALEQYKDLLEQFCRTLEDSDDAGLEAFLQSAKKNQDALGN